MLVIHLDNLSRYFRASIQTDSTKKYKNIDEQIYNKRDYNVQIIRLFLHRNNLYILYSV
jgi:hypothetical protein